MQPDETTGDGVTDEADYTSGPTVLRSVGGVGFEPPGLADSQAWEGRPMQNLH